jgi:hypothetical protein
MYVYIYMYICIWVMTLVIYIFSPYVNSIFILQIMNLISEVNQIDMLTQDTVKEDHSHCFTGLVYKKVLAF